MCVYVCRGDYSIAHIRATQPCHPSDSMLLALVRPRANKGCLLRKTPIGHDIVDMFSLQFLFKP